MRQFRADSQSPFDTIPDRRFSAAAAQSLPKILSRYSKQQALSAVSGLMTIPRFQANTYRLEILANCIVAYCAGNEPVSAKNMLNWLNRQLGKPMIASKEDPPEDVFVSNVVSTRGDFLVLGGLWETPDDSLNTMLEVFERARVRHDNVLRPVYALLRLSDWILKRAGLTRWTLERSNPNTPFPENIGLEWDATSARATVSRQDLHQAGIERQDLVSFVFDLTSDPSTLIEDFEESALQQSPLVEFGSDIILALPCAITYAARRFLLRALSNLGQSTQFQEALNYLTLARACTYLSMSGRHAVDTIALPTELEKCGELGRSVLFRLGQSRYFHLFLLWDDLKRDADVGLLTPRQLSEHELAQLDEHFTTVRKNVESNAGFRFGHTLVVFGSLGQAVLFESSAPPAKWTIDLCRLQDLEFISWDKSGALNRLALMLSQRASLESQGYEFSNFSGLLNLYAYWLELECYLLPPDLPRDRPAGIQLGSDHLTPFRVRYRRSTNRHSAPNVQGGYDTVNCNNRNSIYPILNKIPVYLSLTRLRVGNRCFCFLVENTTIWVSIAGTMGSEHYAHVQHRAWDELQLLLPLALLQVPPRVHFVAPVVELILDLQPSAPLDQLEDGPGADDIYSYWKHETLPLAVVSAGPAFLRTFFGATNTGEQRFLAAVLRGLEEFRGPQREGANGALTSEERARRTLGDTNAKVIHAFQNLDPIEYLLSKFASPVFERPDEHVGACQRTAFEYYPILKKRKSLSREESRAALNGAVGHLMIKVAAKLRTFDKQMLVTRLLFLHETQLSDSLRWRSTARAVQALYGASDGVNAAREADALRSETCVTLRTLIEAAVCDCSEVEGELPDDFSVDELYGLMCTLISLGRHSETIYYGLSSSGITIAPGGGYAFSADLLEEIGVPYTDTTFATGYADAASAYEEWVLPQEPALHSDASSPFENAQFRKAFEAEYGLDFGAFSEIGATLVDAFIDEDVVVRAFTRAELIELGERRELDSNEIDAFLKCFALPTRETWAPRFPVRPKDVEPWRFERRLSVMLRPLIECHAHDEVRYIVGLGTLRDSLTYILDSIINARFDKDVFESREMRSFVGARVDEAGREFTREVASRLRELGWTAREEVKMSELGAGKNPNLGDVDVLAWRPTGEILAIECKRLKGVRTISEIAHSCARFAGREGDHLYKHLRRAAWIQGNCDKVAKRLGLSNINLRIESPLVTSVPVPFSFVKDLPLATDRIVSVAKLEQFVKGVL